MQTQGLARVVTDTVTTLAGEGGALETQGERGKRFARSPGTSLFAKERLCRPGKAGLHRCELEARETAETVRSSSCADKTSSAQLVGTRIDGL